MDQMVLATQQWLNKTYGGVSGFQKAPENGQTGWATIYSLREGLQHELKLTTLGEGFGDKTKEALAKVIDNIKKDSPSNIIKLIKGAFWCKGISPNSFTESYD
ncbi:MAG: peptidoglycan-binding protein, partial [Liquorilactobacillus nagelii]